MNLFYEGVEVHVGPMNDLISQRFASGTRIGTMPVCRNRLWSMTNHCDCLREELFCCIHISFLAQSRINEIAVVINRPIQVTPLPMDLDRGLINIPRGSCLTTSFCP